MAWSPRVVRARWRTYLRPAGARPATTSGVLRGGTEHCGGTRDSPLGWHIGEGGGDGVRQCSLASSGLRWSATSTGSSCSTRPMRGGR
jgi:hypothetical protein